MFRSLTEFPYILLCIITLEYLGKHYLVILYLHPFNIIVYYRGNLSLLVKYNNNHYCPKNVHFKLTCCNITSDTHTEYILTLISASVLAYINTQYSSVSMLTGYITIFLHGKSLLFFSYHSSRLVLNESSSSLLKQCSMQCSIVPRGILRK